MENFFLTEHFDWQVKRYSVFDRLMIKVLARIGLERKFSTATAVDRVVNLARRRNAPMEPLVSLSSGAMTNVEQRMNMYHLLSQVLAYDVPGDVVELGCFEGHSAVLFEKIIAHYDPSRVLHLYDSFAGLPDTDVSKDGDAYAGGQLTAAEATVRHNFEKLRLRMPVIHKGWFSATVPQELPAKICFAHLDGDTYSSIAECLVGVYPRMPKGAICLIDDYCDPAVNPNGWNFLPGVKLACDEFFADKPEQVSHIYSGVYSHAFFRKL